MKRLNVLRDKKRLKVSLEEPVIGEKKGRFSKISIPKIPISGKWVLRGFLFFLGLIIVVLALGYFFVARPVLAIKEDAKELKASTYQIQQGAKNFDFEEISTGLENTKLAIEDFNQSYQKNMTTLRKLPGAEPYYQDGLHLIAAAEEGIILGELSISILEPHAEDLGFAVEGKEAVGVPAQERIVKLLKLMPAFASEVNKISESMVKIDEELVQIDASRYPNQLPGYVKLFGIDPDINIRSQVLSVQAISSELAQKAPQFEAMFNAMPEFMGLLEPKKYMIIMANNYEERMSGGFNTYVVIVEMNEGIPDITYSIDTYFIDEGDRTGSSNLVSRNVPYFLARYLYIQDRGARLYARDATSTSPDFPTAADMLLTEFWYKDRTLPQQIDGVIQINNDIAVNLLEVVGAVNTAKFSIRTDQGSFITIPVTEFNSENVIMELENIAGGKLAETIGRKEIIKFLADSIFEKVYNSEATNLVSVANVLLDSLSKKDVMLYSFDPAVQEAFEALGYAGRLTNTPDPSWDYLHVNRSNFGSGKADWTSEGFVTQTVSKNIEIKNGMKIGTVELTIHNPKRPDWYDIDPCCFYKAYVRVYVPVDSKMISITASDGQEANGAEYVDELTGKTFLESFTTQLKETDLTITYVYELPDTINLDDYHLMLQRQSGTSVDPYTIVVEGISTEILLNADKTITL